MGYTYINESWTGMSYCSINVFYVGAKKVINNINYGYTKVN
ncbi:MAG: hypothetical protein MNSN_10010 [Minisyncoccus archaeiphilus]|nr:MAG: hypothetical protein MNSN_10010 [Candidatus Parcubacteria bacterium]